MIPAAATRESVSVDFPVGYKLQSLNAATNNFKHKILIQELHSRINTRSEKKTEKLIKLRK
jgi:hypothetical protein